MCAFSIGFLWHDACCGVEQHKISYIKRRIMSTFYYNESVHHKSTNWEGFRFKKTISIFHSIVIAALSVLKNLFYYLLKEKEKEKAN